MRCAIGKGRKHEFAVLPALRLACTWKGEGERRKWQPYHPSRGRVVAAAASLLMLAGGSLGVS